jgi:replication factor C subunit 2/4
VADGDMRRSINLLQSCRLIVDVGEPVTPAIAIEVAGVLPIHYVSDLFETMCDGKFDALDNAAKKTIALGYAVDRVLLQLQDVVANSDLPDIAKANICILIAQVEKKLIDGSDDYLQLLEVLSSGSTFVSKARSSS